MPDAAELAYRASPRINWSSLKLLEKSPAHYKLGWGDEPSDSMEFGTAVHMAVLEPQRFETEYVVTTIRQDNRTKIWQQFQAEATRNGKSILSKSEMDRVQACRDAISAKPAARRYLAEGQAEVGLEWELEGLGFRFECKGRLDWVSPLATVDLKTAQGSSLKAFVESCWKYGYYGQSAYYADGRAIARKERLPFVFIVAESAPPHIVTVFTVPEHILERGREQYVGLLAKLDYCQRNNWWGGYDEAETTELTLPRWLENNE